jgi:hypothetical protein
VDAMRIRYREEKELHDIVLDFTDSRFSPDELIKQIAQRLRDNQTIHTLVIENAELYEKGADALCQAVLTHKALRNLYLHRALFCSYAVCGDDDYFPADLDAAVEHISAMLRQANLHCIELTDIDFHDRTERKYEHFDMVDPTVMRDLLMQKEPFYIKQIENSLIHNPHLYTVKFSVVDVDVKQDVKEIEQDIKKRHTAEQINAVLQGTHAAIETYMMPEIFKAFAMGVWVGSRIKRRTQ